MAGESNSSTPAVVVSQVDRFPDGSVCTTPWIAYQLGDVELDLLPAGTGTLAVLGRAFDLNDAADLAQLMDLGTFLNSPEVQAALQRAIARLTADSEPDGDDDLTRWLAQQFKR